jgi:hypothetical protein
MARVAEGMTVVEGMTTVTAPHRLISLAELRDMLAEVMKSRGYLAAEPHISYGEDGWQPPRPLPPGQGLRLSDFTAAISGLPDPCPDTQAAQAIVAVFAERGNHWLVDIMDAEWEKRWPSGQDAPAKAEPGAPWLPMCAYCGEKPVTDKRAKFCSRAHRQAAYKRRKRLQ